MTTIPKNLPQQVGTFTLVGEAPRNGDPNRKWEVKCTLCERTRHLTSHVWRYGKFALCDCQKTLKENGVLQGRRPGRDPTYFVIGGSRRTLMEWVRITGKSYWSMTDRLRRRKSGEPLTDEQIILGVNYDVSEVAKYGITNSMDVEDAMTYLEQKLMGEVQDSVRRAIRIALQTHARPLFTTWAQRRGHMDLESIERAVSLTLTPAEGETEKLQVVGDGVVIPRMPEKNERPSKTGTPFCVDPDSRDGELLYKDATFRQVREHEGDSQAERLWNSPEAAKAHLLETPYWAFSEKTPHAHEAKSSTPCITPPSRPQYRRLLNGLEFIKLTPILKAKHCPKTPHRNLMPVVRDLTREPWDMDRTRDLWFYEKAHVIDSPDALLPPPGWEIVPSVDSFTAKPKAAPPWFAKFVPGYKSWPKGYVPGVWPNQKHVPSFTEEEEALICEAPWWAWRIKGGLQGEIPGGAFPVSQYDRLAAWAHYAAEGPPFGEGPHDEPKNERISAYLGVGKYDWCVDCRTLALAMDFNWAWFWIYQNFRLVPPAGDRWEETLEALFPRIRRWQASHVRYVRESLLQIILNTLHKSAREDFAQLLGFDDAYALFSRDLSIVPYEEHEEVFLDAEDLRLPLGSQDLRLAISAGPDLLKAYEYERELMESDEWPPLYPSHFLDLEDTPALW